MTKKIGTIGFFGLLLIIIFGSLALIMLAGWFELFTQIGFMVIIWIIIGIVLFVFDFLSTKKTEETPEKINGKSILVKIILTSIIATAITMVVVSQYIGGYVAFYAVGACITIIPIIIVVEATIFLILIKTMKGKPLTVRKEFIFYVILAVSLICIPLVITLPSMTPTYQGNLSIYEMSFSTNGSRLLIYSEGQHIITSDKYPSTVIDYRLWNTITGDSIWNTTTYKYPYPKIILSPNGDYLANDNNNSIFSLNSGTYIGNYTGDNFIWVMNGKEFITADKTHLFIWDIKNFTVVGSIAFNNANQIVPSFDGSKIAILPQGNNVKTLSVINIKNGNETYLFNTSVNNTLKSIIWSTDGKKLQLVSQNSNKYQVLVWDPMNNTLIQNTSFLFKGGNHSFIHTILFGGYIVNNFDNHQLIIYNITGTKEYSSEKKSKQSFEYHDFCVSYDRKLIAWQEGGTIEVNNLTTGKLLNTLTLPTYEFKRIIPGFELPLIVCAALLLLLLKRRK